MFYFQEVLSKRGRFGIIWLAATLPNQKIKRNDLLGVNCARSAEDILEILNNNPDIAGRRNVRFSLYLSAQLMFGLISVYDRQTRLFLDETKKFLNKMQTFRGLQIEFSGSIDLEETPSRAKVTLDEPNFQNAPIDFGKFWTEIEALNLPILEYFAVPTPRGSSAEGSTASGHPMITPEEAVGRGDRLSARVEDITMTEEVIAPEEEPLFREIGPELFDGFLDEEPVPAALSELTPGTEIAERVQEEPDVPHEAETTEEQPHVDITPLVPERESPLVGDQEAQDQQAAPPPETSPRMPEPERQDRQPSDRDQDKRDKDKKDKDKKRSLFDDSESSAETVFELEPVIDPITRRRRRRHLIVDTKTKIPTHIMKRNIETASTLLVRPLSQDQVNLGESAESMLSRFGLRALARGHKKFWPNPKTLPEPNDPSRYGQFSAEATDTSGMLVEETLPDITPGDSREARRAGSTFESTGVQDLPSRSLTLSRNLQESREQASETRTSLQVPEISAVDDLSGIRTEIDALVDRPMEPLPTTEIIPEPDEPLSQRKPSREFEAAVPESVIPELQTRRESAGEPEAASPEPMIPQPGSSREPPRDLGADQLESATKKRTPCVERTPSEETPPLRSPTPPSSPLLEDAVWHIRAALAESPEPNQTTFTAVLEHTPKTKQYVAKMFNWILNLCKAKKVVLDQSEPNGEIFITVLW